jgi:hypothetical protein
VREGKERSYPAIGSALQVYNAILDDGLGGGLGLGHNADLEGLGLNDLLKTLLQHVVVLEA